MGPLNLIRKWCFQTGLYTAGFIRSVSSGGKKLERICMYVLTAHISIEAHNTSKPIRKRYWSK